MPLRFILLLISAFISVISFATTTGTQKAHFLHYTTTNGLASNRIFSLQQDKNGFLWIATEFGLQRFDSRRFKVYNKTGYPNLWRDDVLFVNCDNNSNTVILGGYNGFAMNYNMANDKFLNQLEQNYKNSQLSIDDLAKEMAVSQSTLGRRLKSLVGKTAIELLVEYRLNKAKQLMDRT